MKYKSVVSWKEQQKKGDVLCAHPNLLFEARIDDPDTKAKMPRQFEYAHFIHPASLDAMNQGISNFWTQGSMLVHVSPTRKFSFRSDS